MDNLVLTLSQINNKNVFNVLLDEKYMNFTEATLNNDSTLDYDHKCDIANICFVDVHKRIILLPNLNTILQS